MHHHRNNGVEIPWTGILWTLNLGLFSVQMFMKWLNADPIISSLLGIGKGKKKKY